MGKGRFVTRVKGIANFLNGSYYVDYDARALNILTMISKKVDDYKGQDRRERIKFMIDEMISRLEKENTFESLKEVEALRKKASIIYPDLLIREKPPS